MQKQFRVESGNLTKAAKILGVTKGELLRAFSEAGIHLIVHQPDRSIEPIQWDGSQKSANRVVRHMPDRTIGTCGGAKGYPVQLFLQSKGGRQIGEAKPGNWIGLDANGSACVMSNRKGR